MRMLRIKQALKRRRGIVLLIVISLLAMFILMGITFALISNQYQYAAKLDKENERVGDQPEVEMDQILGQILYDTKARTSLQYHSLLRDLYGYDDDISISQSVSVPPPNILTTPEARDTVLGRIITPTPPNAFGFSGGNQLYTFQFEVPLPSPVNSKGATTLSPIPNYYAGRVLTFRSGVAANHSTRVVAYEFIRQANASTGQTATGRITIESIESKLAGPVTDKLVVSDTFVINGAPFNGSGSGYMFDVAGGRHGIQLMYKPLQPAWAGRVQESVDVALLPHYYTYSQYSGQIFSPLDPYQFPIDAGGMDETWDAPDIQNMFLAMVPPRVAETVASGGYLPIVPSFHRPELINFFRAQKFSSGAYQVNGTLSVTQFHQGDTYQVARDFLRAMNLRPMPWDHPNFSGSNANFSPTYNVGQLINALRGFDINGTTPTNPWDVDNDNDGVPDSIWIDPGLPVVTTKDGRRYKRLAAILIKDLDGSINVNAHGNLVQAADARYRADTALQTPMHVGSTYQGPGGNALGLANAGAFLPRGLGFGPAEVSFLNIFDNDTTIYNNILRGRYVSGFETLANAVPGYSNTAPSRDALAMVKHYGIPNDYANLANDPMFFNYPTWYFSPPDVWGATSVALDVGGQPIWANAGVVGEMQESPYEMAHSGETGNADSPYTPAELERLMRYDDPDASQLPNRLLAAAPTLLASQNPGVITAGSPFGEHSRRSMLTTMSSSIPTPPLALPSELRAEIATATLNSGTGLKIPGNSTILDLYRFRLAKAGLSEARVQQEMHKIVPWEFFKGQKFDINRWLGEGLSNDNNLVRDDPNDVYQGMANVWPATPFIMSSVPSSFQADANPVRGQHTNSVPYQNASGTSNFDNRYARQLYARHLFCLAMLLLPDQFQPDPPTNYDANLTAGGTEYRRLMIRRLAQWAVNCVDFRDQDNIMTAFEFDYNPWDGWGVDGDLQTTGADESISINGTMQTVSTATRDLVWGMENPDLLITETLVFHDRRVKDTADGAPSPDGDNQDRRRTDMMEPDLTLDQFRIPQGSAFIELYCPRPNRWTNQFGPVNELGNQKPLSSPDLYANNGNLVLGVNGAGSPVWRIAFSELCAASPGNPAYDSSPEHRVANTNQPERKLETTSFELAGMSLYPPENLPPIVPDRFAYFCPPARVPAADREKSFCINDGSVPQLQPGQYAIVGPRLTTYLGSQDPANANPPASGAWGGYSPQRIVINPGAGTITATDTDGTTTTRDSTAAGDIRPVVGIICDIGEDPNGNGRITPYTSGVQWAQPCPWNIGLNVTEPMPFQNHPFNNYYREPQPSGIPPNADPAYRDFYDDPDAANNLFPGIPLDSDSNLYSSNARRPLADLTADPALGVTATQSATQLQSTAYLQRLADPTLAYDQIINPYVTVDWATMDVTVFSGEEHTGFNPPGFQSPPFDPDDPPGGEIHFRTRQRGFHGETPPSTYSLWSPVTRNVGGRTDLQPPGTVGAYFSVDLSNDCRTDATQTFDPLNDRHTLGYLNQSLNGLNLGYAANANPPNTQYQAYRGEPAEPFPWLTWNNRPFTNPMELLQVPSSSPSRATFEISQAGGYLAQYLQSGTTLTPYPPPNTDPSGPISYFRAPFANLLNFFYHDQSANRQQMHLCRLLDFIEVPSPYSGAERWYNPKQGFGGSSSNPFQGITPPGFTYPIYYRPPFNKLSRFRDPGKININTIFEPEVWSAGISQFPFMATPTYFDSNVARSRSGMSVDWRSMDQNVPTRFAQPFRAADSADLMPSGLDKSPVEATLLRPGVGAAGQQPLLLSNWTDAFRNGDRNPYFRYQGLQKMGSTFTTQSNCFAVWITIGYFEVEDVPNWSTLRPDQKSAWPDGLMLGQEVGADSGEINRHRAFYIIDRSIPVGFMPGSRLNTDDCVLVRRLIE